MFTGQSTLCEKGFCNPLFFKQGLGLYLHSKSVELV